MAGISAWQILATYFPLYLIFQHAAQFPCLNPGCMTKVTNALFTPQCSTYPSVLSGLHSLLPASSRTHKNHSPFSAKCTVQVKVVQVLYCVCNCRQGLFSNSSQQHMQQVKLSSKKQKCLKTNCRGCCWGLTKGPVCSHAPSIILTQKESCPVSSSLLPSAADQHKDFTCP